MDISTPNKVFQKQSKDIMEAKKEKNPLYLITLHGFDTPQTIIEKTG